MLKNNITINKIFNFKYSNEFIERMLTKDLYCVSLSCFPYELPKDRRDESFIENYFEFDNPSHFHPEHSIIYGHHKSLEKTTPLIVKTGESLQYVRELITDEKIPVAYYDINYDRNYIKSDLHDKNGKDYPFYIKVFRSRHTAFIIPNYAYCLENTGFSNFNDKCKLSSFSLDQAERILKTYHESNCCDRSVEGFREELLKCFAAAEEYMKNQILQEQQKYQQVLEEQKQKKKLIGSYFQ